MRCFPHADGNEIGRGIQCGEMLAKRLAAGLDTDTEEYRRSVQALCPDKVKRGLDAFPQRASVHQLPQNPLQAYSGGKTSTYGTDAFSLAQNASISPSPMHMSQHSIPNSHASNLLGIHVSVAEMQQWEHQMERYGAMSANFAGYEYEHRQQPGSQADRQLCSSQQQQQQQQQYLDGEHQFVSSPYKVYCPPMHSAMSALTSHSPVEYQRPDLSQRASDPCSQSRAGQPREEDAARVEFRRSASQMSALECYREAGSSAQSQTPPRPGNVGTCSPSVTSWTQTRQHEPASVLPKDIWAPAPKRPTLIPVDPEDVSREKRAKPQPIGTRSATTAATTTRSCSSSSTSTTTVTASATTGMYN